MVADIFLYSLGGISAISLSILMFLSAFTDIYHFWPPESKDLNWVLYWVLAAINTSVLLVLPLKGQSVYNLGDPRIAAGVLIFFAGFTVTTVAIIQLGLRESSGLGKNLVTTGIYSHTRNPQVIGNIVSLAGLAVLKPEIMYFDLLVLTASWLFNMVYDEERWMKENLSDEYEEYYGNTPRFFFS